LLRSECLLIKSQDIVGDIEAHKNTIEQVEPFGERKEE
jgi:hypothetical protein